MMTVEECLRSAASRLLTASGDAQAERLEAEMLLAFVLGQSRTWLYTWPEQQISDGDQLRYQQLLKRRIDGEPIAYITGRREFWSMDLRVSPATLIPRPETELLVELALELLPQDSQQVVDLGTGSGAIALALAKERPEWLVAACDFSAEALRMTALNRREQQCDSVLLFQSDWASVLWPGTWDLIVSNPPYIDPVDVHLQQGDVRFEPQTALVAAEQGLADIRIIIEQACSCLKSDGWLMLEHGFQQAGEVRRLLQQAQYRQVQTRHDLNGNERVTLARRKH